MRVDIPPHASSAQSSPRLSRMHRFLSRQDSPLFDKSSLVSSSFPNDRRLHTRMRTQVRASPIQQAHHWSPYLSTRMKAQAPRLWCSDQAVLTTHRIALPRCVCCHFVSRFIIRSDGDRNMCKCLPTHESNRTTAGVLYRSLSDTVVIFSLLTFSQSCTMQLRRHTNHSRANRICEDTAEVQLTGTHLDI